MLRAFIDLKKSAYVIRFKKLLQLSQKHRMSEMRVVCIEKSKII